MQQVLLPGIPTPILESSFSSLRLLHQYLQASLYFSQLVHTLPCSYSHSLVFFNTDTYFAYGITNKYVAVIKLLFKYKYLERRYFTFVLQSVNDVV